MSEFCTPDEAIQIAIENGVAGISLGLAKELQAERDQLRKQLKDMNIALTALEQECPGYQSHTTGDCFENDVRCIHDRIKEVLETA